MSRKNALLSLWKDLCSVVEYQKKPKMNSSTGFEEVVVFENLPCKLSYSTLQSTAQNGLDATIVQVTKLFLDKNIQIKAGSKITVVHNGKTFEFSQSGEPGQYTFHQEIVLAPFKGWA